MFSVVMAILIPICGLLLLRRFSDLNVSELKETLTRFDSVVLFSALVGVFIQVLFQVLRLRALVPPETSLQWLTVARAYSYGQFLNAFVPSRAGDVFKVLYLKQKINSNAFGFSKLAGIIVADKVVDVLALIILVGVAVTAQSEKFIQWFNEQNLSAGLSLVCLGLSFFLVAFWWLRRRSVRVMEVIGNFINGLGVLKNPMPFTLGVLFGLGAHLVELAIIFVLCNVQGYSPSYSDLVWIVLVINLGIAVPISWANLGVYEAAMSFALTRLGVPLAAAIGIATVHHVIQIFGITLWASVLWLWGRYRRQVLSG